ncbi:DUF3224 family protein [Deinococcus sp. HMF7620]|uniref:DUF3224 family protein n=1 Tax=Deinococcus arboris TaxID=2682977 RepID=A0A7C9MAK2_9DEIO|nr:DUF3224 domain-containing protein [Deinococcus arboris]MVN88443.1 DUF3224 family protein [Deinococcus arboris]
MSAVASGTFAVTFRPPGDLPAVVPGIQELAFDKLWTGDLSGHSQGHMLAYAQTAYVALEVFTGTLAGRTGQFAFAHLGDQAQGQQRLLYRIVEGSGQGDLSGICGELSLSITDQEHRYAVHYTL